MTETIKTICAWCNTLIKDGIEPILFGKKRVSHGLCKDCHENWDDVQKKLWDGENHEPKKQ